MAEIWPEDIIRPRSKRIRNFLVVLLIGWMALYPVYRSYYSANGLDHYRRHLAHVQGNSMFFNPWQYRVLCPMIIEGLYWIADHSLFAVVEVKGIDLGIPDNSGNKNDVTAELMNFLKDPQFVKYSIVFLTFRMGLNIAVLVLCFHYFSRFVRNKMLIVFALMTATLFMGNSVVDSDLTFNTYFEIVLYIAAGIIITKQLNPWWIVLLTGVGALNRETSIFIPALYFFSRFSWKDWTNVTQLLKNNRRVVMITSISAILFISIFISVRAYYGLKPVSTWRVEPGLAMLKLNLFSSVSIKSYMEFFGVFGFLPLWCLLIFSKMNRQLKIFFLTMVPIWFVLHVSTAIAYQSRLFLVPTVLVILPAVLENIESHYKVRRPKSQESRSTLVAAD